MAKDKEKEKGAIISNKEKLIIFTDEKGEEKGVYGEVIEQSNSTITFKTRDNIFTIPVYRLIKIKEPIEK